VEKEQVKMKEMKGGSSPKKCCYWGDGEGGKQCFGKAVAVVEVPSIPP
jgi:hypothetical protein